MRGLPQLTVLLLILLLPSQAVCLTCLPDLCPMQVGPEPVEVAEPTSCHQMADHGAEDQTVVTGASMKPDCCAVIAEPEDEAPAVLTQAPAGAVLAEAPSNIESSFDGESPVPQTAPLPTPHPPLYHLHSSLLI